MLQFLVELRANIVNKSETCSLTYSDFFLPLKEIVVVLPQPGSKWKATRGENTIFPGFKKRPAEALLMTLEKSVLSECFKWRAGIAA
jgi:hypothetical protein